jgi:hypothetical protein
LIDAGATVARRARFRIGRIVLCVDTDHASLLDELHAALGDCELDDSAAHADGPQVTAFAGRSENGETLRLAFTGSQLVDLLEAASAPFRLLQIRQCYREGPAADGWRTLVNHDAGDRLLMRARDGEAEIVIAEAPREFISDFLVSVAQRAQPDVFFFHAASFAIGEQGALICASGRGGKSTLSLAMASRGHQFLGDDLAAITRESRTMLPFPKAVGLRAGIMAEKLAARVAASPHVPATGPDGIPRVLIRASDLFPGCLGPAAPLRYAYFLDGFAPQASAERVTLSLADIALLRSAVSEITPSWGRSAGRDLLQFLALLDLLRPICCYRVKVGTPDETAELFERLMGDGCT